MKKLIIIVLSTAYLLSVNLFAQPSVSLFTEEGMPRYTAEQIAEIKSGYYFRELGLDDKQYKKMYDLYLVQAQKNYPVILSHGGFMIRAPFSGSAANRLEAKKQMERELRRMENELNGKAAARTLFESEKSITGRNKKVKKILSPEQYRKWAAMEKADIENYVRTVELLDVGEQ